MSYINEVIQKENLLLEELEKDQNDTFLRSVRRPDGAKEALEFQYENIDTLSTSTLEKYLGALSQYLIFVTKYVNILSAKKKVASSLYTRNLNKGFFINSEELKNVKSITEKEMIVKHKDESLLELQEHIDKIDAKLALYSNIPDTISSLIQSIKKVYDARNKETQIQNNN